MESSYNNFAAFLNDLKLKKSNDKIPSCINGDYCISGPKQMNNGILTMAFVDMQPLENVYSSADAFKSGTFFPNLNKPFLAGGCK